jgi:hypothetical protein
MFVMDDFARRHLREWFTAGLAPYGWDLGVLETFEAWCEVNADELPEYASWSNLARSYEEELEPMTLDEIKAAVDRGQTVCWENDGYEVRRYVIGAAVIYDIVCVHNAHAIGLTWLDGVTMNGDPEDFYIKKGHESHG